MDLSLQLGGTHVLLTGGSGMIGSVVLSSLLSASCLVTSLDLSPSKHPPHPSLLSLVCDIGSESALADAFAAATAKFGPVACCIALAGLDLSFLEHHESLVDMGLDQWRRTHRTNIDGTFLTARAWLRGLRDLAATASATSPKPPPPSNAPASASSPSANPASPSPAPAPSHPLRNVSLIVVGSESGTFGERGNADYAAGKSAVQVGLLRSLIGDVGRIWPGARVNAVAPGPVDTAQFRKECRENPLQLWVDAQATTGLKKPVPPEAVAKAILFLASEAWSGSIMGQVIAVDSGKQGKVLWLKEDC